MSAIQTEPELLARPSLRMSEDEYVAWSSGEKGTEWVDGEVIFKMSVEEIHDVLARAIGGAAEELALRRGLGEVRGPEFTMRLRVGDRRLRRNPDVLFVATENLDRLGRTLLEGPGDLAIEIVSTDSRLRDYHQKFDEYQAAGVREYWIIDPAHRSIDAYRLDVKTHQYVAMDLDADKKLASSVLPGFRLQAADLFTDPLPRALSLMKLLGVAD